MFSNDERYTVDIHRMNTLDLDISTTNAMIFIWEWYERTEIFKKWSDAESAVWAALIEMKRIGSKVA